MNPVLEKILKNGYAETPSGEFVKVCGAISREEGEFLQQLIFKSKPNVTLEIGLAFGISTLFICDALIKTPQTCHIVIDPNQFEGPWGRSWGGIGLYNLEKAGFKDIIEFYNAPSYQVLSQLEKAERKIDFAFIDGWHTFDYVMVDFFYIDKMLKTGGVVIFDDANWPSIRKVCKYIVTNLSYSVLRTLVSNKDKFSIREILGSDRKLGLNSSMIALKKESEDKRRWDYHVPF